MRQLNSCGDTNETDGIRNTKAVQIYNKNLNQEIKNFLQRKAHARMVSLMNSIKHFKKIQ